MIRTFLTATLLVALASPLFAQGEVAPPKTLLEKVSYGIGLGLGRNLTADGVQIDLNWLVKGVQDGSTKDAKPLMTDEEYKATMTAFQKEMMAKQKDEIAKKQEEQKIEAAKNKAAGDKFLADNAKKQGVQKTESGLQYAVITRGTGASPKATDKVKVHYHGMLIDGTVFDSSVDRKEPATFPVNRVIPGWTEALQLMKVGDKWRLYIPSELAYGDQAAGDVIGPNSVLVFDVELLDIVN